LVGEAARYELGESTGPDMRLATLLDAAGQGNLGDMPLAYGTTAGDSRLRQAIAEAHGVTADDVVVTIGGIHALFLSAFILCNRGDEAVTTSPLFPLARHALDVVGAQVRTLPLAFERDYQLDPIALRGQLSPATKLVSLASPQNPSGVAIPPAVLCDVLAALEEQCPDAYLLLDETYREAVYGDNPTAPSAATLSPRVIAIASLSKCHGAPGLRLGWAITRDPALREQLVLGKFHTVISCSPVCEALALQVLAQRERIMAERRRHLAAGLAQTAEGGPEHKAVGDWVRPDGGAIFCGRLKTAVFEEVAVRRFYAILAGEGVRVANGTWFGDEARVFRLGIGLLATPDLTVALNVLAAALQQTVRAAA